MNGVAGMAVLPAVGKSWSEQSCKQINGGDSGFVVRDELS